MLCVVTYRYVCSFPPLENKGSVPHTFFLHLLFSLSSSCQKSFQHSSYTVYSFCFTTVKFHYICIITYLTSSILSIFLKMNKNCSLLYPHIPPSVAFHFPVCLFTQILQITTHAAPRSLSCIHSSPNLNLASFFTEIVLFQVTKFKDYFSYSSYLNSQEQC